MSIIKRAYMKIDGKQYEVRNIEALVDPNEPFIFPRGKIFIKGIGLLNFKGFESVAEYPNGKVEVGKADYCHFYTMAREVLT